MSITNTLEMITASFFTPGATSAPTQVASTVSATTQVANQCFSFESPCQTMVFRYNQLAQQSNSSGIVFAVTAAALCSFAVSQCAVACYNGWTMTSERIRWMGVAVSLILATGYAVGAGMTINYDNQTILDACLKQ